MTTWAPSPTTTQVLGVTVGSPCAHSDLDTPYGEVRNIFISKSILKATDKHELITDAEGPAEELQTSASKETTVLWERGNQQGRDIGEHGSRRASEQQGECSEKAGYWSSNINEGAGYLGSYERGKGDRWRPRAN